MTHSIFYHVPPKKYFKAHPDWFTMDASGRRVSDRQLCFSSAAMKAEFERNFIAHVAAKGGRGVFDVTAQDLPGDFCSCAECRAASSKFGSVGAAYYLFVRHLAGVMRERFPEAILHFSAYRVGQTEVPPNAAFGRFPDNCALVFAPIDNDFSKTYLHPANRPHLENFRAWGRIVPRLWEWYYPLPYGDRAPFAGVRRTAEDLKTAYGAGLTGGTFEHDVGTRIGAGFADLHTYMISRLFCDPETPWRPVAEEFCRLYYGAAADMVLSYMDELDALAESAHVPLVWNGGLDAVGEAGFLFKWNAAFDKAEGLVAGDARLVQRLRECRLSLESATVSNWRKLVAAGKAPAASPKVVADRALATCRAAVDRRFTLSAKVANQFYEKYAAPMRDALHRATVVAKPLPPQFASLPERDIIDILVKPTQGAKSRRDSDAAIGIACYDPRHFEKPLKKYEVGFFDREAKRHFPRRTISREEVVPDKYHFYKIGTYEISRDCLLWFSWTWRLQQELGKFWEPGGEGRWEVYASLKLEGPFFSDKSRSRENGVSLDRIVLVRTK